MGMYTKIYNLKFAAPREAKIASTFLAEEAAGTIRDCNVHSLHVFLDQDAAICMTVCFGEMADMRSFAGRMGPVIDDLKGSFQIRITELAAVSVFSFERDVPEAA